MRPNIAIYIVVAITIASALMMFGNMFSGPLMDSQSGSSQTHTATGNGTSVTITTEPEKKSNVPPQDPKVVWGVALSMVGLFLFSGRFMEMQKKRRADKFRTYMEKQFKDVNR